MSYNIKKYAQTNLLEFQKLFKMAFKKLVNI